MALGIRENQIGRPDFKVSIGDSTEERKSRPVKDRRPSVPLEFLELPPFLLLSKHPHCVGLTLSRMHQDILYFAYYTKPCFINHTSEDTSYRAVREIKPAEEAFHERNLFPLFLKKMKKHRWPNSSRMKGICVMMHNYLIFCRMREAENVATPMLFRELVVWMAPLLGWE